MNSIFQGTMANMNWRELQRSVDEHALVLLPIGVIEEHGPHLCLGTDIYTAHLYCQAVQALLAERNLRAVLAPPFYWGICQSTGGFIGSFSARKETVSALVFDILASLKHFGYRHIFGINAHGDIEHNLAMIGAFREARNKLAVDARYCFDELRIPLFGLDSNDAFLCPVKPSQVSIGSSEYRDVHGGDMETATISRYYPDLVDAATTQQLPPVELHDDQVNDWLFGGHIRELSPDGYLGTPADYPQVDVAAHIKDQASRITEAILACLAL
jgi:creatinine amidohydrolase